MYVEVEFKIINIKLNCFQTLKLLKKNVIMILLDVIIQVSHLCIDKWGGEG